LGSELYDAIGADYSLARCTDPRWMTAIEGALAGSRTVLNVGAGTGSYEPAGRRVVAVEPSGAMIGQRRPGSAPAVRAIAEALPVPGRGFEAVLAVLTVHHWTDWQRGIAELRRAAPLRIVLAYDTRLHAEFWFARDYVPEIAALELDRPSADDIADELGADTVTPLLVPWDFADGVFPAYWRRPSAYLDPALRRNCSAFAQVDPGAASRGVQRLSDDLGTGRWHDEYRDLLDRSEFDAGFRLIVSGPGHA
jgi:SAM-dependent methyltransferase